MEEVFNILFDRIIDTLDRSDLLSIKEKLSNINSRTILVGAGGSLVVAYFASKILNIGQVRSYRDLNYMDLSNIDNIIIFSYSGASSQIENLLDKGKKVYLFTNGEKVYDDVELIKYDSSIEREHSFISIAATLMPMTILYQYFNGFDFYTFKNILKEMFLKASGVNIGKNNIYEILTGYDSITASSFLESTMVESGIAVPVIHDKYNYCHGRTTLSYHSNNGLILFDSKKELDKLFISDLEKYYDEVVILENLYENDIVSNDFYWTLKSMYLMKKLALNKSCDLSRVDYSPMVKKLYNYKGEM